MSEERLHFGHGAPLASAMDLAEHFVRYASVKPLVQFRRVLDFACGEGYGARLMKDWGADSVVGVDISSEAILKARSLFGGGGVEFVCAGPEGILEAVQHRKFDLIVSLETIEHVADPLAFLSALASVRASGGVVVISCPNDHVTLAEGERNPFHLRRYTYAEFQSQTEQVLGPADGWYYGTNAQGYAVVPVGLPAAEHSWERSECVTQSVDAAKAYLTPSHPYSRPSRDSAAFYLGSWGAEIPAPISAVAAQSYESFAEPWRALDWLKSERARLEASVVRLDGSVSALGKELEAANEDRAAKDALARELDSELQSLRRRLLAANELLAEVEGRQTSLVKEYESKLSHVSAQRDQVLNSRAYRLVDATYYRLFMLPGIGRTLRTVRSRSGSILRRIVKN